MSAPASSGRPASPAWGAAALCAVAAAAVFQFFGNATRGYIDTASLFRWWAHQWVNPDSETQHGLIVLGLAAWLLWRNLRRSGVAGGEPWRGRALTAMAAGLALHALGYVAQQARISILGLLLFAWGAGALGGGSRWGRAAVFPLAFMVFAIPLDALDSAGFWLRMWVVDASTAIAHAIGIGVLRNGTQLLAPDGSYNYDVAAACSGVRSLTALAALSLLLGYLRFRPAAVRAAFFALCFPLVYLGNVARIVAIVVAARAGGTLWGDRVHAVMGFGVFAIVLAGLFGLAEAVAAWRPDWETQTPGRTGVGAGPDDRPGGSDPEPAPPEIRRSLPASAVAALVVAVAAADGAFLAHVAALPELGRAGVFLASDGRNPASLPTFAGDWIGRPAEVTRAEKEILPPDTGYSRKVYVSVAEPAQPVLVSIVLSGRDRSSIHRPELCLVGQGWTIAGSSEHRFHAPGGDFPATVLRVSREAATRRGRAVVPQLVAYWFVSGDAIVATHMKRLMNDAWNRIAHGRADRWAYILLQTGASDGEPAALRRMQSILDGTLPAFQKGKTVGKKSRRQRRNGKFSQAA